MVWWIANHQFLQVSIIWKIKHQGLKHFLFLPRGAPSKSINWSVINHQQVLYQVRDQVSAFSLLRYLKNNWNPHFRSRVLNFLLIKKHPKQSINQRFIKKTKDRHHLNQIANIYLRLILSKNKLSLFRQSTAMLIWSQPKV